MEIVAGAAEELSNGLVSEISSYRYRVFVEMLKWDLPAQEGVELDQFDGPDTIYVAVRNEFERIVGVARLLPTNRPYLLRDVFPQLLNGLPPPCNPQVWELSRFAAVDLNDVTGAPRGQLSSPIAVELLHATIDCAIDRGARRLITVSPIGIERLLRRAGFHAHRAGPPMVVGGHPLFACWIELDTAAAAPRTVVTKICTLKNI